MHGCAKSVGQIAYRFFVCFRSHWGLSVKDFVIPALQTLDDYRDQRE